MINIDVETTKNMPYITVSFFIDINVHLRILSALSLGGVFLYFLIIELVDIDPMKVEGMNLGCVSMSLRLVRRWMTGWRRRHGDETRIMNTYVGPLMPT